MRYLDQETPNPVLRDPLARIFAGEGAIMKWREELGRLHSAEPFGKNHVAIRARALDDIITAELKGMQPADLVQVVSLGAGMCTRAWRLPNPGSRVVWFEVDRPDSMRLKQKIASTCGQPSLGTCYHIGMDFENPNASLTNSLLQYGFRPHAPTIFVIEGVLCYLTIPTIEKQAKELHDLAKGKACIVHTVINAGFLREMQDPSPVVDARYPGTKEVAPLIISCWEGGIRAAFEQSGWPTESVVSREDYAQQKLGVDMLHYDFPDRRIGTELIVLSRRCQEVTPKALEPPSLAPLQFPQTPQIQNHQALLGSSFAKAFGTNTSTAAGNAHMSYALSTSQGATTMPVSPTKPLPGASTLAPSTRFIPVQTSYSDKLSATMPTSPSSAISPMTRLPLSPSFSATGSASPRRTAYTPKSPSRDPFGMTPAIMVL
jgi:methyltransferase (TIGR00027 family)